MIFAILSTSGRLVGRIAPSSIACFRFIGTLAGTEKYADICTDRGTSRTGHSRKIAHAIATAIGAEAKDIRSVPTLAQADLLLVVGGIYGGHSDPGMLAYIRSLSASDVRFAALFTSSANGRAKQEQVRDSLTTQGISVLPAEFICRGSLISLFGKGHPHQGDLAKAVQFARDIVSEATTMKRFNVNALYENLDLDEEDERILDKVRAGFIRN